MAITLDMQTFGALVRRLEREWMLAPGPDGDGAPAGPSERNEALALVRRRPDGVATAGPGAVPTAPATPSGPADSGAGAVERSESSGPASMGQVARVRSTLREHRGAAA